MLKYFSYQIVFQELPEEVSLCFEITGCPLRCPGCHSPHLRNHKLGEPLTIDLIKELLNEYEDFVTCVLFMGGDWEGHKLLPLLQEIQNLGYKTALFSGFDDVSDALKDSLDYLKTGPYIKELGGLDCPETTNQKLVKLT
jgi:anaerobic ribonucleoside-triphosphate reductase activating protein